MTVEAFIERLQLQIAATLRQYGPGMPLSLSMLGDLIERAASGKQPPTKDQLEYGGLGKKMERTRPHKHENPYMDSVTPKWDTEVRWVLSLEEENKAIGEGFSVPQRSPYSY